jgi:hypothetical protein
LKACIRSKVARCGSNSGATAGALRLKFRRDRRSGLKRENPLLFYPRYAGTTLVTLLRYWKVYRHFNGILKEVLAAPDRWTYSDLAIAPPLADEFEVLSLYHATSGGEAELARKRRNDAIREHAHHPDAGAAHA